MISKVLTARHLHTCSQSLMTSGVQAPLEPHIAVLMPPAIPNRGSMHEYIISSHSKNTPVGDTSAEFDVPLRGAAGGGSQTTTKKVTFASVQYLVI